MRKGSRKRFTHDTLSYACLYSWYFSPWNSSTAPFPLIALSQDFPCAPANCPVGSTVSSLMWSKKPGIAVDTRLLPRGVSRKENLAGARTFLKALAQNSGPNAAFVCTGSNLARFWWNVARTKTNGQPLHLNSQIHLPAKSSDSAMAACWGHLSAACPRLPAEIPNCSPNLVSIECHICKTWLQDLGQPTGSKEIRDLIAAQVQKQVGGLGGMTQFPIARTASFRFGLRRQPQR